MNYFEKFCEDVFNESKDRFIDKLNFLTNEEKNFYKSFFKKHPQLESKVEWQKPDTITKETLEMLVKEAENSSTHKRKDEKENPEKLFLNRQNDFEILLQTENWIFVWIKTYEGARFCNSSKCGGQGAKWCIGGDKNGDADWIEHHNRLSEDFILAYNKSTSEQNKKKWVIAFGEKNYVTDQTNNLDNSVINEFGISLEQLYNLIPKDCETLSIKSGTKQLIQSMVNKNVCEIILPESLESIGNATFYGCKNLSTIVIPKSVKSIGDNAFSNCFNLKSIKLYEGLERIGNFTFSGCNNLKELIIPKSVTTIGENAFCFDFELLKLPIQFKNQDLGIEDYLLEDNVIFY